jgi:hypothetical protein
MTEPTVFAPIELTDAELDAVSGAGGRCGGHKGWKYKGDGSVSIPMSNGGTMIITEQGGSIVIDGSGITINGGITLTETFNASTTTDQGVTSTGT